ncbi:Pet127 protein [Saccharomycopsis crataegensis]|uniref:Pet127 protein n=1 Tax=Saccharomycopsis crataegensis TaxID=43959 RepID=A0AAV5QQQ4_9ASCO|nr:Pet127 protein [Saccharomycopsis crataegensis]
MCIRQQGLLQRVFRSRRLYSTTTSSIKPPIHLASEDEGLIPEEENGLEGEDHILGGENNVLEGKNFLVEEEPVPEIILEKEIDTKTLVYEPIKPNFPQLPVPPLAHNLSKVLFQPNVYHQLQDKRTRVYSFPPFLENVVSVDKFDFNKVKAFIPSGRDPVLLEMASDVNKRRNNKNDPESVREKVKYYSSTSSMTGLLSQLHFALSNNKQPKFKDLSLSYSDLPGKKMSFSPGAKTAAVVVLKVRKSRPGLQSVVYSIDADKSTDDDMILSILGNLMETLLITKERDFKRNYVLGKNNKTKGQEEVAGDTYHYAKMGKFLVRSQLDCYDPRLPNTGTFDLKTRAVCSIRVDIDHIQNTQKNRSGYQIIKRLGGFESYEKEKYDLIRSAMLKYSFQARIGNMDGIFVCYHNIEKIFGFEYIPLTDIDELYHHDPNAEEESDIADVLDMHLDGFQTSMSSFVSETEFKVSFKVLEDIIDTIVNDYLVQNGEAECFRMILKAKTEKGRSKLYVLFTPLNHEQVNKIQNQDMLQQELALAKKLQNASKLEDIDLDNIENDRNLQVKLKLHPDFYKAKQNMRKADFQKMNNITSYKAQGFKVSFDHYHDGELQTERFAYPKSRDIDWKVNYTITKLDTETAQRHYKKFMQDKGILQWSQFDSDYTTIVRQYDQIGRLREEFFAAMEDNGKKVVWKPDK